MSQKMSKGTLDFFKFEPKETDFKFPTYDEFLDRMKDFEAMYKPPKEVYNPKPKEKSEWDELDWELIKNRINFKLKANYIKERLQAAKKI